MTKQFRFQEDVAGPEKTEFEQKETKVTKVEDQFKEIDDWKFEIGE